MELMNWVQLHSGETKSISSIIPPNPLTGSSSCSISYYSRFKIEFVQSRNQSLPWRFSQEIFHWRNSFKASLKTRPLWSLLWQNRPQDPEKRWHRPWSIRSTVVYRYFFKRFFLKHFWKRCPAEREQRQVQYEQVSVQSVQTCEAFTVTIINRTYLKI